MGGGFDSLMAAIDQLATPVDRVELEGLFACRHQLDAVIAAGVDHVDRTGGAGLDGAVSTTSWVMWRGRLRAGDAAQLVRAARLLRTAPRTATAWRNGTLSSDQVHVIARHAAAHAELWADHEADLLADLEGLSVKDTATVMALWAARADATTDPTSPTPPTPVPEPFSTVHLSRTLDGRWVLTGDLDSAMGERLAAALRLYASDDPTIALAQRRAHALDALAGAALDHRDTTRPARHRPHVNVHIRTNDDGRIPHQPGITDDGHLVDPADINASLCDCTYSRIVWNARGELLDLGRPTRLIPTAIRRAVITRDHRCRYPGCDRPASWTDLHHITHLDHGGHTSIDNLCLLCGYHHRQLHRHGWHAKLHPDATLTITTHHGRTLTSPPPPRC